jgi:hypothetical protein
MTTLDDKQRFQLFARGVCTPGSDPHKWLQEEPRLNREQFWGGEKHRIVRLNPSSSETSLFTLKSLGGLRPDGSESRFWQRVEIRETYAPKGSPVVNVRAKIIIPRGFVEMSENWLMAAFNDYALNPGDD